MSKYKEIIDLFNQLTEKISALTKYERKKLILATKQSILNDEVKKLVEEETNNE